jgi:DNA repair protein RadC
MAKVMQQMGIEEKLRYRVPEVRLALIREREALRPIYLKAPGDAHQILEPLRYASEEQFVALHLNCMNEVMGYRVISRGTVSSSLVHPRDVFKAAILDNAYAILVAHNHPAGTTKPSPEDLETTSRLIKAGVILGVSVMDHLIIACTGAWSSIREELPHLWDES